LLCRFCGFETEGGINGCFCVEAYSDANRLTPPPDLPRELPIRYRYCHRVGREKVRGNWNSWNHNNHYSQWYGIIKFLRKRKTPFLVDYYWVEIMLPSGRVLRSISSHDV